MLYGLFQEILQKFAAEVIIALGGIVITTILGWFATYWRAKKRIEEAEQRVTRVRVGNSEREGQGIWLSEPIRQPAYYDRMIRGSRPVIVVGNLKGGVGKTTVATNLAAHYAVRRGERVLLIDADYQGSASSMLFTPQARIPSADADSPATVAFGGFCTPDTFRHLCKPANAPGMLPGLSISGIPAYYDLAQAENRLMIEWVIKAESKRGGVSRVGDRDIRYFLATLLHDQAVSRDFDRVVIDAPPRLTSACVQAFCASTHLLIPTVLDFLSGEAVATFVEQVKLLRERGICPHLKIIGVVPYVPARALNFRESARQAIRIALEKTETEATLLDETFEIPSLALISETAGERIPYAVDGNSQHVRRVREVFDALGNEISRRIEGRG